MIIETILALNISFIQSFGYWIIFLATFLESFPVLGLFVPGSLVIFIGGFLAKFQVINTPVLGLWDVVLIAIVGAILGDLAAYIFGRYAGKEFMHKYGRYFLIKREYIEKTGEIICNHTGKSLILGRFNPITRSAAPFIVGANKIRFSKFMFFNILGGLLWGLLFVALGYTLGHSYTFTQKFEKVFIIASITVIVALYAFYFSKLFVDKRRFIKMAKVGECVAQWPG